MSAVIDEVPTIKVLVTLQPSVNALDVVNILEVLNQAQHKESGTSVKAFECVFVSATENVTSAQGAVFHSQATFDQATKRLAEFDVLIIPGGGVEEILKTKSQPLQLIKAWSDLQIKNPTKERTIVSIGTGSLFLGESGILAGLSATTHPDYLAKFENICSKANTLNMAERTDVLEERYVVNNLRFDLGENEEENPYIRKKSETGRRPSNARKGSMSWKESNTRRESNARRLNMRLGGLRVITAGGVGSGTDASLYLVSIMVSLEVAEEVAKTMQHEWTKGVVVDGLDI